MDNLKELFAETLRISISKVEDSLTMKDVIEWDSLTHMELIAEIEAKYGIQFTGDEIAEMQSYANIKKLVIKYRAKQSNNDI